MTNSALNQGQAATLAPILVCDDEAPIRHIVAHKLRAAGHEVLEGRNGLEGLELATLGARTPRLVLTDLQMPVMTGIDLCRRLRLHVRTKGTPVLMLTARGYILTAEELAATNIRGVISKPFGVRQLLDTVTAMLAELDRNEGTDQNGAARAA